MKTWMRFAAIGAVVLGVQTAARANPLPVSSVSAAAEGQAVAFELMAYDCGVDEVAITLDGAAVDLDWTLVSDDPLCWDSLEVPGEQTCVSERVYAATLPCVALGEHALTADLCGMRGDLSVTVAEEDPACGEEPEPEPEPEPDPDGDDDRCGPVGGADAIGGGETREPHTNCLPDQHGGEGSYGAADDGGAAGCSAGGGGAGPWSALALVALVALRLRRRPVAAPTSGCRTTTA